MGESGREKLFASVALFCGVGAIPVCLKLSDGWDFPLFPTLAAGAAVIALNAFLSSLPRK
ncbi:MAG: hypothetical protein IKX85_01105 [Clostridia bacterium]|nr:hypothetical protein [Clostridia bacterium]